MIRELKRIVIIGYFGYGNTGDEAILESMISAFRKRNKDIKFIVFSGNPEFISSKYGVKSLSGSMRRNLKDVIKTIKDADLVILGGGGFLFDYKLLNLLSWLLYVIVAKSLRRQVMIYAMGIGPINTRLGKLFAKYALNKVDIISVRDKGSKKLLIDLGVKKSPIFVTADPAIIAPYETEKKNSVLRVVDSNKKHNLIGIAIRPWFNSDELKKVIAEVADSLIMDLNSTIVFIPMEYGMDYDISKEVSNLMINSPKIMKYSTPQHIYETISQMDLVIGMRLHSLIFATKAAVPIVGIIYDPKVDYFLQEINQSKYSINVNNVTYEDLLYLAKEAMSNRSLIEEEMRKHVEILTDKALFNVDLALTLISKA
jgi:polysaccharide pyruvyl transferase CsaB